MTQTSRQRRNAQEHKQVRKWAMCREEPAVHVASSVSSLDWFSSCFSLFNFILVLILQWLSRIACTPRLRDNFVVVLICAAKEIGSFLFVLHFLLFVLSALLLFFFRLPFFSL